MITKDIRYIGVNDKDLDLFEGQYAIPNGVSYNSYVILDDQVAVLDTVDKRKTEEFLANLERELQGRSVDYLVVNHLEPDHASSIRAFVDRYPKVRLVGKRKNLPDAAPVLRAGSVPGGDGEGRGYPVPGTP